MLHRLWDLSSPTRDQTFSPLHWKPGVLTMGLPGKSPPLSSGLYFSVQELTVSLTAASLKVTSPPSPPPLLVTCKIFSKFVFILVFLCYCSVAQFCPTLCDPVDCSTPGFPVLRYLLEFDVCSYLSSLGFVGFLLSGCLGS